MLKGTLLVAMKVAWSLKLIEAFKTSIIRKTHYNTRSFRYELKYRRKCRDKVLRIIFWPIRDKERTKMLDTSRKIKWTEYVEHRGTEI
jgi:hypothetical protein